MDSNRDYHAYLLRLWRVGQVDQPDWRVLLERVETREQRSFASLEEAFEYLRIILSTPSNVLQCRDQGGVDVLSQTPPLSPKE